MARLLPILWIVLVACQSTLNRPERHRVIPNKTMGPLFDDDEVGTEIKPPQTSSTDKADEPEPTEDSEPTDTDTDPLPSPELVISDELPEGNPNLPFGLPHMTGGETGWIIARGQYVISWNPKTRNPNWVAWKVTAADLGTVGRSDSFTIDPSLSAYLTKSKSPIKAVASKDYTGSCFDRGHQVASNDRQASEEDNITTFHMTNILPQTAFLNQRIWKGLEEQARTWIQEGKYQNLWILSGPVYEKTLHYMGPDNNIAIPSANYKVIFSWDEDSYQKPELVKAILVPNMNSQGKLAYNDKDRLCAESKSGGQVKGEPILKSVSFEDYKATVPAIEAAAHIQIPTAVMP